MLPLLCVWATRFGLLLATPLLAALPCSQPSDMEGMRRFVADAFDTLLRQAHVDAKLKTGTLGCQVRSLRHQ